MVRAGLPWMETMQPMGFAYDETRDCIRRLVAVIRRSSSGDSPVDVDQVEHIQKVIRVLSLSEEQVSSMRCEDRAQVVKIRSNALQKMRMANNVRLSASSDGTSSGASSPLSVSPPGPSSSYGSPFSYRSPNFSSSAPTAIPMQVPMTMATGSEAAQPISQKAASAVDSVSMPPPAFYVRRERVSET